MPALFPHQLDVLAWFEANSGRVFSRRPFDVGLPIKVTSSQRGIWKPASTPYAVSVVQTHKGVYPDQPPIFADDGTWTYFYHQQGSSREDLIDPDRDYTNRALQRNWHDDVPVGVIVPDSAGYKVLGLGRVVDFVGGMFMLEGPVALAPSQAGAGTITVQLIDLSDQPFDPNAPDDGRNRVIAEVVRRQGRTQFRRTILAAYEGKCAMSAYDAEPALEAAHIVPYRGTQTNHPANGLLLRADLHDLFDLGLIAVDPDMRIQLASALAGTMYEPLHESRLRIPNNPNLRPSPEALERHYERSLVA